MISRLCFAFAVLLSIVPVQAQEAQLVPLTVVSFSAPDSAHGRRWVTFENEIRAQLGDRVALAMLTGG